MPQRTVFLQMERGAGDADEHHDNDEVEPDISRNGGMDDGPGEAIARRERCRVPAALVPPRMKFESTVAIHKRTPRVN